MIKSLQYKLILSILFLIITAGSVSAQISVDAGLTPSLDRWIFRVQSRFMERQSPTSADINMKTYSINAVGAYGLKRNLTLIIKSSHNQKDAVMNNNKSSFTGFGDISFLTKYTFYRLNDPDYTFGLAGVAGVDIPVGDQNFSSETWNSRFGLFSSFRTGFNSFDINLAYAYNGISEPSNDIYPGNRLNINLAYTRQILLGSGSDITLAPVVELKYTDKLSDERTDDFLLNNGESLLTVAPGFKVVISSFIIESLIVFPLWQNQQENMMEFDLMGLVGIRYLY